jgi:hypothetical protein
MATADELRALAERVMRFEGPCRETDAEILAAIGEYVLEKRAKDRKAWWYRVSDGVRSFDASHGGFGWPPTHPRFTASLDAAMTLVPEGWTGLIPVSGGDDAWLWREGTIGAKGPRIRAATPALALTAAALLACAALKETDDDA